MYERRLNSIPICLEFQIRIKEIYELVYKREKGERARTKLGGKQCSEREIIKNDDLNLEFSTKHSHYSSKIFSCHYSIDGISLFRSNILKQEKP